MLRARRIIIRRRYTAPCFCGRFAYDVQQYTLGTWSNNNNNNYIRVIFVPMCRHRGRSRFACDLFLLLLQFLSRGIVELLAVHNMIRYDRYNDMRRSDDAS